MKRSFLLFSRIAVSVHNALNRVIASRADKESLLVTTTVIRMRTPSRQVSPLAAIGTCWPPDCAKASRQLFLVQHDATRSLFATQSVQAAALAAGGAYRFD